MTIESLYQIISSKNSTHRIKERTFVIESIGNFVSNMILSIFSINKNGKIQNENKITEYSFDLVRILMKMPNQMILIYFQREAVGGGASYFMYLDI